MRNIELGQEHNLIAMGALLQLDNICIKICDKSITLKSLDVIKDKCTQLMKLCDAVNSGGKDMCMSCAKVEAHLDECIRLQSRFLKYKKQISTLIELCGNISNGMLYSYIGYMIAME